MEAQVLLTVAEVAKLTGFSEGTLRHWVSQHRIPVVRFSSRCVRFNRNEILKWIEAHSRPSQDSEARGDRT